MEPLATFAQQGVTVQEEHQYHNYAHREHIQIVLGIKH